MPLPPGVDFRPKDKQVATVTPEMIAAQAGFYHMRSWTFSWSREEKKFHLRAGGLDLYVTSVAGYTEIEDADVETGRMVLNHAMTIEGDGAALFANAEAMAEVEDKQGPMHQMCFNRAEGRWHIWETTEDKKRKATLQQETERKVSGYTGPAYVFWPRDDRGGHLYTTTPYRLLDGWVVFGG